MQAEGWPSMQWERFSDETVQAYHLRTNEIQQIVDGFRMGRYRGEAAEQLERRLLRLQEQASEPELLSA